VATLAPVALNIAQPASVQQSNADVAALNSTQSIPSYAALQSGAGLFDSYGQQLNSDLAFQDRGINSTLSQLANLEADDNANLQAAVNSAPFGRRLFSRSPSSSPGDNGPGFDTSLAVGPGFVNQSYSAAVAGLADPTNSPLERGIFGLLAVATAPLAFAESFGGAVLNVPNDVSLTAQQIAQGNLATNTSDQLHAYLGAAASATNGLLAGASVAIPLFSEFSGINSGIEFVGSSDGRQFANEIGAIGPQVTRSSPSADRIQELVNLFDPESPVNGIQIGNRTLLPRLDNTGKALIFDGASELEVQNYFSELTGVPNLPAATSKPAGSLYFQPTTLGNFNLRDFASSSNISGPVFTIDIPAGTPIRNGLQTELKFGKGS
jgi:hypothetical protein